MKRIKMKSGQEYDALTTAKRYFSWKPGQRKQIKRAYNKRFRSINRIVMMKQTKR